MARGEYFIPLSLAVLGVALVGLLQFLPKSSDRDFAAVFAPGMRFEEAAARVNRTGAFVLSVGAFDNIIIARLPAGRNSNALSVAGAWLLLSARSTSYCSDQNAALSAPFRQAS